MPTVKLLWSRRIGDSPATPSRWMHRLLMILETARLKDRCARHALADDGAPAVRAAAVTPIAMPKPRPPVALRPKALSVTRIEKLVRDPYAIYARHVLRLEPLKPVATAPDPARRGIIFHGAIGDFLSAFPQAPARRCRAAARGASAAGISSRSRIIPASSASGGRASAASRSGWRRQEPQMRDGVERVAGGAQRRHRPRHRGRDLPPQLPRRPHRPAGGWRARASSTTRRAACRPTKQVEAGLAPQLTLQAAILARGGFRDVAGAADGARSPMSTSPAAIRRARSKLLELAGHGRWRERHLAELEKLLDGLRRRRASPISRAP